MHSSPTKYTVQSSERFGTRKRNAEEMKKQLAGDLHCQWVGPMPVDQFFKEFLDIDENILGDMPILPANYYDKIPRTTKEPAMYQPFIELVEKAKIAPTLKLVNTSQKPDKNADKTMQNKPDITAYDVDAGPINTLDYAQAEVIFEFKPENKPVDPFNDLTKEQSDNDLNAFFEATPAERTLCRGQLACYARAWMAAQNRTHCFMVYFGDPSARIIRFDRTGGIVTELFNVRSGSHTLSEFLWRISFATPEMRGMDPTVSVVTDKETIKVAHEKLAKWKPKPETSCSVLKLQIPDGGTPEDPKMREVLVWVPLADPWCVAGRATRGYPGWDLKANKHVFVKDSWRVIDNEISKETDILKTLKKAGVCNVPRFLYGDDLPGQITRTQQFAGAEWNQGGRPEHFSTRAHIRFSTKDIGIDLTKFTSSKMFVQAWSDALLGHKEAYEKCKILHRDISLNNILILSDGSGLLNDWDLARTTDDIKNGPRQPSRSGTWQFMSIYLLGTPNKQHELQDDLEAFFWVLLYVTIRFLHTNLVDVNKSIPQVMNTIFDAAQSDGLQTLGGDSKQVVILTQAHIGKNFHVTNNVPLSQLILDILRMIKFYLNVSINLEDCVEEIILQQKVDKEAAKRIYRDSKARVIDNYCHTAMLDHAHKALKEEWPIQETRKDYCDIPDQIFRSTKRTVPNDAVLGPQATKRSKTKH